MAATATTGETRIPEAARRERTVATCEECGKHLSATDLRRHHAHRVVVGSKTTTRWECLGHEGHTSQPVDLYDSAPVEPPRSSRYVMDLSVARSINERVAKAAPNLAKARVDNNDAIKRLARIAGQVGGEHLSAMQARLGLSKDATPEQTMRAHAKAIGEEFVRLSKIEQLDEVFLGCAIAETRLAFREIEKTFGFDAGDGT
jgi:ssDNA-binding Zn-finger/Zn-ribbon topoisomerase 1